MGAEEKLGQYEDYEDEEYEYDDGDGEKIRKSDMIPWWMPHICLSRNYYRMQEDIEDLKEENAELLYKLKVSANRSYISDAECSNRAYQDKCREAAEATALYDAALLKIKFYENFFEQLTGGSLTGALENKYRDIEGKIRSADGLSKEQKQDKAFQMVKAGIGKSAIMQELGISSEHTVDNYVTEGRKRQNAKTAADQAKQNRAIVFNSITESWKEKSFTVSAVDEMLRTGRIVRWSDGRLCYKTEDESWVANASDYDSPSEAIA